MITIENINKLTGKKLYDIKHERVWLIASVKPDVDNTKYFINVASLSRPNSLYAPHTKYIEMTLIRSKQLKENGYRLYDKCSPYIVLDINDIRDPINFMIALENRIQTII